MPYNVLFTDRTTVVYLECVASGNPSPTYTWYREIGTNVTQKITSALSNRFTLSNGRLTISSPNETADTGVYQCKAENQYGSILSSFIDLTWGYLEQFSNVPLGTFNVPLYQGTVLNCIPPSYKPAVTYQWRKNGNFLFSELNHYYFLSAGGNLYFSEVQQSDEGDFHCIVTLAAGQGQTLSIDQPTSMISPKMHLTVTGETAANYHPQIHNDFPTVYPKQPMRGERIRLECLAYGRMPLKYSWRREGKPIPARAKFSDLDRVITIDNVDIDDEGTYTCHVGRLDGSFDEKSYTLSIGAAPYFVSPLQHVHADLNSELTWRCEAIGKPRATYTWYKNSQPLQPVTGKLDIVSNVLKIYSLTESDIGMYQCGAHNVHGTTFSNAQLRVLSFKPSFQKHPLPKSMLAGSGGNLTIPCVPEAAPIATIVWKQNNQAMGLTPGTSSGNKQMLLNGYLRIIKVTYGDAGFYTCSAENTNGKAESTTKVTVAEGISLVLPPNNTFVYANETAFIRCEASYDFNLYDLVYEWRFNGKTIDFDNKFGNVYQRGENEGTRGLYINYANFYHAGDYECIARSTTQRTSGIATLTVIGPPGEPARVYCEKDTATPYSIQVTWFSAPDHGSSVISYILEASTSLDENWIVQVKEITEGPNIIHPTLTDRRTFVVGGLTPFSSYRFRVRAKNNFAEPGPASLPSTYYTLPKAAPVLAPANVGGGNGSVGVLYMSWQPLAQKDWCGETIGYNLYWRLKGSTNKWQHKNLTGDVSSYTDTVGENNYYLEYEVKVGAWNEIGPGPNSTIALVYSAEGMPTIVPTNINGYEYNSTAIIVYWDKIPNTREVVKGRIMGFE
ncbi:hypothetical protein KUTeg_015231 [Tegillarca granosa]|uniref:Contactin n=1 Tax=Tegillarca granosa TaxID=220873 RepID=A0ABQ9EPJ3_TEGGR|nr:hypothetical protein KUTeg_015231 [Tegillarca granosa]